jgi:hypothetical protein
MSDGTTRPFSGFFLSNNRWNLVCLLVAVTYWGSSMFIRTCENKLVGNFTNILGRINFFVTINTAKKISKVSNKKVESLRVKKRGQFQNKKPKLG